MATTDNGKAKAERKHGVLAKHSVFVILLLTLACNTITRGLMGAEPTPTPTHSPTPTLAPTFTPAPTPSAYIPPGCENVPPATVPAATALFKPTPEAAANAPIASDEQQRIFEELVKTVDRVYVYPDFNGKDWGAITTTYRAKIQAGLDTESFYTEMEAMINELGDEHSRFQPPSEVALEDAELSGVNDYVGLGIFVLPLVEKQRLTVLSVFPDSSAEHGGLKPHDSILAVDGVPIVQDGVAYPHRVRGPECSAVVLTVQSPGEPPRDLTFVRYHIVTSLPIDARLVNTTDGSRIGYIFLPTFFDETVSGQVKDALENFGTLDGLIVDNRMNEGGINTVMESILGHFTSGTPGQFASRAETRPLNITADPINNSQTVPLAVLVGEGTVSFGEIFAGVLQDSGRAKLVGQTTLGNVEILHSYYFEDGSRTWIAEETFDPAVSHANWETAGIVPDVEVIAGWDTFTFETDPAVAAAVELLGHK